MSTVNHNPISALLQVVRYEVLDAIRSRQAVVLMALYTLGAAGATWLFSGFLGAVERQIAEGVGLQQSDKVGGVTETLQASEQFAQAVAQFSGNPEIAAFISKMPPLAIFYGWLAFTFIPLLVVLLSSSRIADQVWSGSVRYAVVRCPRLLWCIGKYFGQAIQILIAMLAGAVGAWIVGWLKFDNFQAMDTLLTLAQISVRAWVYGLPFLGLALGVSQMVRGPYVAVAVAVVALTGLAIVSGFSGYYANLEGASSVWDALWAVMPKAHRQGLWSPSPAAFLTSAAALFGIGIAYFIAGHYAFFARKDL